VFLLSKRTEKVNDKGKVFSKPKEVKVIIIINKEIIVLFKPREEDINDLFQNAVLGNKRQDAN